MLIHEKPDTAHVVSQQSLRESLWKSAMQVHMSYSSEQGGVQKLNLQQYYIHKVQRMKKPNRAKCLQYLTCFQASVEENRMKLLQ